MEVIDMKEITISVTTLSNLLIGGNESGFVIGGIDQHAVIDHEGRPYIPGSSFKGALRKIVREDNDERISKIFKVYKQYLVRFAEESKKNGVEVDVESFRKELEKGVESDAEYMFGIAGYNQSPKLMFSDLYLDEEKSNVDKENYFSIDAKNSVDEKTLVANPRFYKVARKGLVFTGTIRFKNFEKLNKLNSDKLNVKENELQVYVIQQLENAFKDGFYRLGNSKSRGYGHIQVKVCERK
jgi:CRISPR-associated protein Csm3